MRYLFTSLLIALAGSAHAELRLPWQDAEAVAQGQEIYGDYCAACHGAQLEGQVPDWRVPSANGRLPAPPHDASGHTWHHSDALLFRITKYGTEALIGGNYRSDMQGFGDLLSDKEILAVLGFIKSTWPKRVLDAHARVNAAAQ